MMRPYTVLLSLCLLESSWSEDCLQPSCEDCQLEVEQEAVTSLSLDWSEVWWDLDLQCLSTLQVTLNGRNRLVLY